MPFPCPPGTLPTSLEPLTYCVVEASFPRLPSSGAGKLEPYSRADLSFRVAGALAVCDFDRHFISLSLSSVSYLHRHPFHVAVRSQGKFGRAQGNNLEKDMAPTPVLSPGKSHGRRGLVGCSPWGREESDTTERLHFIFHFHFSLSCIGAGNGNPLQCSCLENPRDRGAWWLLSMGSHRVGHD